MSEQLQRTVLAGRQVALGARMVPFAGWEMPVQYSDGIIAEHQHTRNAVSLFDICHMGEFQIRGTGAVAALDRLLARPVLDQPIGSCRYNFLLNDAGGVLDDLVVYRMAADDCFLVVNAGTRAADAAHLRALLPAGVTLVDLSDGLAKLDLQGPRSAEVLAQLGVPAASLPKYFHWTLLEIAQVRCILSRTGYTGELGFELYFDVEKAGAMWDRLLEVEPVKPAGLGARDTLRLEMGYSLYGHELTPEVTPLDVGAAPLLKLAEQPGRDFVGRAALEKAGVRRRLIGIGCEGRRAARGGYAVRAGGRTIGTVTSGAFAPSLGVAVALASVTADCGLEIGDPVSIETERAAIGGKVRALPFYPAGSVRKKL
ncbi:glycine cleavage system aminomethyltransferase GcvT [Victivallis sp. Marseille-Q1083]|uniref:glycine cleavage system aminomethyltransferase GcvT n=1 Tax=Victivallis sp. Marseille-Q1083 TaxID=2717288 RepID=UPI001589E8F2|nr:glycine cleavage system aminomethyltransferase GcvT [Victivallis sp. Marseille-Q1083]